MTIAEKLTAIAENEQRVYDTGYMRGSNDGYVQGEEAGKRAEYDAFWDAYQQNGNRQEYSYAFAGRGWTDDILKPKYDIRPTNCMYMFANARGLVDVEEAFLRAGIVLDTSNATDFTNFLLTNTTVKKMPMIDISNASSVVNLFSQATELRSVKLTVSERVTFADSFNVCNSLSDVEIVGVIGTSINFMWSPLSKESIKNIINHLSDTVTGKTLTLSKAAKEAAFPTEAEWQDFLTGADKGNWTFSLV